MAKGASTEQALGGLHTQLTAIFTRVLTSYETRLAKHDEAIQDIGVEDELMAELLAVSIEPSPAMLSAISKFLKDNEITFDSEELDTLSNLRKQMADKKKKRPTFEGVTQLPLTGSGD